MEYRELKKLLPPNFMDSQRVLEHNQGLMNAKRMLELASGDYFPRASLSYSSDYGGKAEGEFILIYLGREKTHGEAKIGLYIKRAEGERSGETMQFVELKEISSLKISANSVNLSSTQIRPPEKKGLLSRLFGK